MNLKPVEGWWCPCVGPDAGMNHHAAECARRVRVRTFVPSYPDWRPPRAKWLDNLATALPGRDPDDDDTEWLDLDDDADELPSAGPIVRCRELTAEDPSPPSAWRLLVRVEELDPGVRLTYAKGWGRRKMPVPADDGVRHFEPWPVESVVLRSRVVALAWTRKDGDKSWKAEGGYAVWAGRIWPVRITQAEALIASLEREQVKAP